MTVEEIHEYLLAYVPDKYDTDTGSFFSDLLKPVAAQIYLLQNEIDALEDNCFALTASGGYLDRKAAEQGLTRRSGTFAKGIVRITGVKGEVVRAGAKVAAENVLYSVDETVTIPGTGFIEVNATCTTAGSIGNVKAGKINRFPVMLRNLTSVENITDFTGGYDEESDAELLERYLESVSRPNTSGNKNHYISWAKEVEGVGNVQVIPLWNGPGTVKVVITNYDNAPADEELIAEVAGHIEDNRPIGSSVTVATVDTLLINISVSLTTDDSSTAAADIELNINKYLSDIALEKSYVSYAKIGGLILDSAGVEDYSQLRLNGGTSNVDIPTGYVPVLDKVVVS